MDRKTACLILGLKEAATMEDVEVAYNKFKVSVEQISGALPDDNGLHEFFPDVLSAYRFLMEVHNTLIPEPEIPEDPPEPQSRFKTFTIYLITFIFFVVMIAFLHQLAYFTL
jgi:hypothetical protein